MATDTLVSGASGDVCYPRLDAVIFGGEDTMVDSDRFNLVTFQPSRHKLAQCLDWENSVTALRDISDLSGDKYHSFAVDWHLWYEEWTFEYVYVDGTTIDSNWIDRIDTTWLNGNTKVFVLGVHTDYETDFADPDTVVFKVIFGRIDDRDMLMLNFEYYKTGISGRLFDRRTPLLGSRS